MQKFFEWVSLPVAVTTYDICRSRFPGVKASNWLLELEIICSGNVWQHSCNKAGIAGIQQSSPPLKCSGNIYEIFCGLLLVSATPAYEYPQVFSFIPFIYSSLKFTPTTVSSPGLKLNRHTSPYKYKLYPLTIDIAINRQSWTSWLLDWVLSLRKTWYTKKSLL